MSKNRYRAFGGGSLNVILLAVLLALIVAVMCVIFFRSAASSPAKPSPAKADLPDNVQVELLTENEWSRPGTALRKVNGIVIHYVGNPGTSAMSNRNYFESLKSGAEKTHASSHFIVGLEGEIIQCIPLTEIAYASKERNKDTISIEVCHPDAGGQFNDAAYDSAIYLTAWLCRTFRLDPKEAVIRHYDATGKICPKYYVENEDAWETFKADVKTEMSAQDAA